MRLAIAVVALSSAGIAATPKHRSPVDPNQALFAKAKQDVADQFRDPLSTQFRGLSVVTDARGVKKVCGSANSKNGYGAYAGFRAFAYLVELGEVVFATDEDDPEANDVNKLGSGCPGFGPWHG